MNQVREWVNAALDFIEEALEALADTRGGKIIKWIVGFPKFIVELARARKKGTILL